MKWLFRDHVLAPATANINNRNKITFSKLKVYSFSLEDTSHQKTHTHTHTSSSSTWLLLEKEEEMLSAVTCVRSPQVHKLKSIAIVATCMNLTGKNQDTHVGFAVEVSVQLVTVRSISDLFTSECRVLWSRLEPFHAPNVTLHLQDKGLWIFMLGQYMKIGRARRRDVLSAPRF